VNLGTRGVQEALDVLEYANIGCGTAMSDMRIAHGIGKPYNIRMWCLGNEMDGPWQLGHSTAQSYAELASKTARAMRQIDPDLELVVCGSSSGSMPTFGIWERTVLEETYEAIDFISCHAYYEPILGDYASFLASAVDMDLFIEKVVAIADGVKAVRGSDKTIHISFDEWNVWYHSRYLEVDRITAADNWPVAPRILEDSYSVVDAVVFGNLLISLLRHADRVTAASLAQLVNVIAPIMTEPDGPAWRQTTFFPFAVTSRLARGVTLELKLECPTYETKSYGSVPVVDAVATRDEATDETAVFLVNRSMGEEVTIEIDISALGDVSLGEIQSIHDDDIHAANTLKNPDRVQLRSNESVRIGGGTLSLVLPKVSWTALTLA